MSLKTGLVIFTVLLERMCRTLNAYYPKMIAGVNAAVVAGAITEAQASQVTLFINSARGACDILKIITGY